MATASSVPAASSAGPVISTPSRTSGGFRPKCANITYGCDCGRSFPLETLYYCQSCQKITCKFCVTQEIDSYYCPNCLENMASSEAMLFKNSCKKCFLCPFCFCCLTYQTLPSTTPSTQTTPTPSIQTSSSGDADKDKTYFLGCGFCRWDSIDLGLKADSPTALIAKIMEMEKDSPLQKEVSKLIEKLQKEERERAKEKRQKMRKTTGFARNAPNIGPVAPSVPASMHPTNMEELERQLLEKQKKRSPKENETQLEEEKITLDRASTLEQRFLQVQVQPRDPRKLFPKRTDLMTRGSKHCCKCDKLLTKPDLSPSKIEFKRQHVALVYVPKLTLVELLSVGDVEKELCIKFANPVHSLMHLVISSNGTSPSGLTLGSPLNTFIASKDHDEEDETSPDAIEHKALKSKDDQKFIKERKLNWVVIKLPFSTSTPTSVQVSLKIAVQFKGTSGDQSYEFLAHIDIGTLENLK